MATIYVTTMTTLSALENLNIILKNTLNTTTFSKEEPEYYIDYLNLACLLAGVRNGSHLDNIVDNDELIDNLKAELKQFQFNTRFETTVWNPEKIMMEQAMNSWAFQGDVKNIDNPEYWVNNARLLGNDLGYPTFTMEPTKRGTWSINLTLKYDGTSCYPTSMMGGLYDKTKDDDLRSVKIIHEFLLTLVGCDLYNPYGYTVFLETVELEIS